MQRYSFMFEHNGLFETSQISQKPSYSEVKIYLKNPQNTYKRSDPQKPLKSSKAFNFNKSTFPNIRSIYSYYYIFLRKFFREQTYFIPATKFPKKEQALLCAQVSFYTKKPGLPLI